MSKARPTNKMKTKPQTKNVQNSKSTRSFTKPMKKQQARNTNNSVQSKPWHKQKRGAAAQHARSAKVRIKKNKRSLKRFLAYKNAYASSLNRTTAFFEWTTGAHQFKKIKTQQRRYLLSELVESRKHDVAAVKKYVTSRKRSFFCRNKRMYASFYSKRTKSFYLIRNKDILLKNLKSKVSRAPLTYYKQKGFERSRSQIRAFQPTLRSFWQFLENYKISVCSELTNEWRKKQHAQLCKWAYKYALFPGMPRFYLIFRICKSLNAIAKGMHPDERRVRILQRKYERWCNRRPRSLSKGRKWIVTETKEIGAFLKGLDYTTTSPEWALDRDSSSVAKLISQMRRLRSIVAAKQKTPRLPSFVKKTCEKSKILKTLRKIKKLKRILALSKRLKIKKAALKLKMRTQKQKVVGVNKSKKATKLPTKKIPSKLNKVTKAAMLVKQRKQLKVVGLKKRCKARKAVKPRVLKKFLKLIRAQKLKSAFVKKSMLTAGNPVKTIKTLTSSKKSSVLKLTKQTRLKKLKVIRAKKSKAIKVLRAAYARRRALGLVKKVKKPYSSTLRQWTQFVWRFLSPENYVDQKNCIPSKINVKQFKLKNKKPWENKPQFSKRRRYSKKGRRLMKRAPTKKKNFPTPRQKLKHLSLNKWLDFSAWTKSDSDVRALKQRCWQSSKMHILLKTKRVWRVKRAYGRLKIKKPKKNRKFASRVGKVGAKKAKARFARKFKSVPKLNFSTTLSTSVKLNFSPSRSFSGVSTKNFKHNTAKRSQINNQEKEIQQNVKQNSESAKSIVVPMPDLTHQRKQMGGKVRAKSNFFRNTLRTRRTASKLTLKAKKMRRLVRRLAISRRRRKLKETLFAKSAAAAYVHPTRRAPGPYDRAITRVLLRKRWNKVLKQLGPVKQWNESYERSDRTLARKLATLRFRTPTRRTATLVSQRRVRLAMSLRPAEALTNFHVDSLPFKGSQARTNEQNARSLLEGEQQASVLKKPAATSTLSRMVANNAAQLSFKKDVQTKITQNRLRLKAQDYGRLSAFSAFKKTYRRQLAKRRILLQSFLQVAMKALTAKAQRRAHAVARRKSLAYAKSVKSRKVLPHCLTKKTSIVVPKRGVRRSLKTKRALRNAARQNSKFAVKAKKQCLRSARTDTLPHFSGKLLRDRRQHFIKLLTTPTKPKSFLKYGNAKKQTLLKQRRNSKKKSFGKTLARTYKMLTQNLSPRGRKGRTWWAKKRNGTANKRAWLRKVKETAARRILKVFWYAQAWQSKTLRTSRKFTKRSIKTLRMAKKRISKQYTKKRQLRKRGKTLAAIKSASMRFLLKTARHTQNERLALWHQRNFSKLQPATGKSTSVWKTLKREDEKNLMLRLGLYAPAYRLRSRLLMRKNRRLYSKQEIYQQKLTNKRKWVAARNIYLSRQKLASAWNKANRPFIRKASISGEERRKRDMYSQRWLDEKALRDRARVGQPVTPGYRRLRRTLVPAYNKTRWWKPTALPLPHYHPYALYPRNTRLSKKSNMLQRFKRVSASLPSAKTAFLREVGKKSTLDSELLLVNNALDGDKLKNLVLPKNWNSTAFFTEERAWKNNTNWQLLEKGVVQTKTATTNQNKYLAGQMLVDRILKTLENANTSVWQEYGAKQSAVAAKWLQKHFVESSNDWLSSRPIEKLVSTWTLKAWAEFRTFYELGEDTSKNSSMNIADFREHFIQSTRNELFQDEPNWWEIETKVRVNALFDAMETGVSPDVVVKTLNASAHARNLFDAQRGFGWQEKKLLIFASLHLAKREDTGAFSRALTLASSEEGDLGDKPFTTLYYRWLAGIETHLKKVNKLRSSHDYNEFRGDVVTNLDTDRPRFPGSGRKKNSFDAFLRREYSRTMPQKQRRLGSNRLKQLRPNVSGLRATKLLKLESLAGQRRSKRTSQKTPFVGYPTRQQRELFVVQKNSKSVLKNNYKGRFMTLPLALVKNKKDKYVRQFRSKHVVNFSGNNEALMQVALQKRYVTREIRDLRKAGRRRRVTSGSGPLPFWMKWKKERRLKAANSYTMYQFPETQRHQRPKTANWTFSEFALTFAKQGKRAAKLLTPFGEIITPEAKLVKRPRVALKRKDFKKTDAKWNKAAHFLRTRKTRNPKAAVRRFKRVRVTSRKKRYNAFFKILPKSFTIAKLVRLENAKSSLKMKLLKQKAPSTHLTPLHFRNVTKHASVSAEEKEEWRLHIRASRQRRYRRLTQLSESLTSLMPQLMSRILAKKMKTQKFTAKQAAKLVHSMYWSLRFYLRTDYENEKFDERDRKLARLQLLKKEITALAEERFFPLTELTRARYRFQPHTLHKGPSQKRGAIDWLRQFLPRYYELYLEDPEKYKHLTLTPIKVFRAQFGSKKTAKWATQNVPGFMENQYRRLTSERYNVSTPRFENMLMTTRRSPMVAGHGSAAALKVISPIGSTTIKESFFSRKFHSSFFRESAETKLVLLRMAALRKQTTTEINPLPQVAAASTRVRLKVRVIARSRAQQIDVGSFGGPGSLDIRLLRAKSPRNAEYLQRLAKLGQRQETLSDVVIYRQNVKKNDSRAGVFHGAREFFASSIVDQSNDNQISNTLSLQKFRKEVETRRSSTFLRVRKAVLKKATVTNVLRRLFTRKNKAQNRNFNLWMDTLKPKLGKDAKYQQLIGRAAANTRIVSQVRSILHYRKANNRIVQTFHKAKPIIINRSIQVKKKRQKRLLHSEVRTRHSANKLRGRIRSESQLSDAVVIALFYKKFMRYQKMLKKAREKRVLLRSKKRRYKHVPENKLKLKAAGSTGGLKSAKTNFSLMNTRTKLTYATQNSGYLSAHKNKQFTTYYNFFNHTKNIRANKKSLSQYGGKLDRKQSKSMWALRRVELWKSITLRKSKKLRVLKRWLKGIKYSLKEKKHWTYQGQHALPDILFKLSRIRLRKLEWRESDERFYQHGLKNAFTFHPRERANAPWLEALTLRRSTYSFQRGEYRRHQLPREQKSRKWLQKVRKLLFRKQLSHMYIKGRRWPLLRRYNQKFHRSAFRIRNSKAALKRFRKSSRKKPTTTGLERSMIGFGDRLDVNLMLLNIAPTTYWARQMAKLNLLRVNGKTMNDSQYRLSPGDYIEFAWNKILKFKAYFKSPYKRFDPDKALRKTSLYFPGNFAYNPKLRAAYYLRTPRPEDLRESGRINELLFRWNRLDSGLGR